MNIQGEKRFDVRYVRVNCDALWTTLIWLVWWVGLHTHYYSTRRQKMQFLLLGRARVCAPSSGPHVAATGSPHDNGHVKPPPPRASKRPMMARCNRSGPTSWERFVLLLPCCASRGPHLRAHLFSLVLPAIMLSSSLPSFILLPLTAYLSI